LDLDPGTVVANRYRISRQLGRGGMGEVFAAENIRTGRPVAVKLLRSDSKTKSSAVARFRREARAAGSINSDHVTQVLDVEEDAEHGIVLVFELLEGESLIDRLKRTGPIPFDELHPIIEQVWIGLADAHKAGIIHRDLKPSNVFLERRPDGQTRVKILDFGISKLPKEMGGETLTEMGQSLGTFSFMPPEQIGKAKTVDHRADIYACGTLIYQALSGQLPYAARNILVMVEMKSKTDARRLADAMGSSIDPRLESFLSKTLARDPTARYQSAVEALTGWKELRPAASQSTSSSSKPRASRPSPPAQDTSGSGPKADLPLAMETTTDTAATIAMPLSHLTGQGSPAAQQAEPRRPELRGSPVGGQGQGRPPLSNLQRTLPLNSLEGAAEAMRQVQNQPHPGPAYRPTPSGGMPAANAVQQQVQMYRQPTPQSGVQLPQNAGQQGSQRIYDDSTSQPPSQEKTRVYKPSTPAGGTAMARPEMPSSSGANSSPLTSSNHTLPIPLQRRRSAVPFGRGKRWGPLPGGRGTVGT